MSNTYFIFPLLFFISVSCQNDQEQTIEEIEVQNETNRRGQLSDIELNDDDFKSLLNFMYEKHRKDSLKDLTLLEQEIVFRITNTWLIHGTYHCRELHSFYNSEESEKYATCNFNQNFEEQFKELYPDYVDYPSMSGYYVTSMNIWLWRGGYDNFIPMCPKNFRNLNEDTISNYHAHIELRSNP